MTLVEAVVVICVLAALVVVLLPALVPQRHAMPRRQRINCVNNLKEIGLAFRVWEGDNGNKYPMETSVTNGGAMEFAERGIVYPIFQVMSNELSTPKLLICPEDTEHFAATNFSNLTDANISYFLNLDASDTYPQMIFSGDDNFLVNGKPVQPGILNLWTNSSVVWAKTRHISIGNIGLADGSVQQVTRLGLASAISNATASSRLVIP